jgi:hypothetical protein
LRELIVLPTLSSGIVTAAMISRKIPTMKTVRKRLRLRSETTITGAVDTLRGDEAVAVGAVSDDDPARDPAPPSALLAATGCARAGFLRSGRPFV